MKATTSTRKTWRIFVIVAANVAVGILTLSSCVYRCFQEYQANEHLSAAAGRGDVRAMSVVLAQGYPVDIAPDESDETALLSAARAGSLDGVNFLLAHGADVDHHNYYFDQTALLLTNNPKVARTLLVHGADPNATSKINQLTPLLNWAKTGDEKVVLLLLRYGANPTAKNSDGKTPAEVAKAAGHGDVAKVLRAAEAAWKKTH